MKCKVNFSSVRVKRITLVSDLVFRSVWMHGNLASLYLNCISSYFTTLCNKCMQKWYQSALLSRKGVNKCTSIHFMHQSFFHMFFIHPLSKPKFDVLWIKNCGRTTRLVQQDWIASFNNKLSLLINQKRPHKWVHQLAWMRG